MKVTTLLSALVITTSIIFTTSCKSNTKSLSGFTNPASDSLTCAAKGDSISVPQAPPAASYDSVAEWVIDITAISTDFIEITAEEAARIDQGDFGKYAQLFKQYEEDIFVNDADGRYVITYHPMVVETTRTVTEPDIVDQLNKMMQSGDYEDYNKEVRIEGHTAHASWYGGNRGGGIGDEFPSDLAQYLYH